MIKAFVIIPAKGDSKRLVGKNKKIIANDISNIFSQLGITLMEKGKNKMPEAIYDIIKDEGDPIQLIKFVCIPLNLSLVYSSGSSLWYISLANLTPSVSTVHLISLFMSALFIFTPFCYLQGLNTPSIAIGITSARLSLQPYKL